MTATMSDTDYFTAHEGAIAMSLYRYNVSPGRRATRLYSHFEGACAELDELLKMVDDVCWPTRMAFPTARVYMEHALAVYGQEARDRILVEKGFQHCHEHDVDFPISEGCEKCNKELERLDHKEAEDGYRDRAETS